MKNNKTTINTTNNKEMITFKQFYPGSEYYYAYRRLDRGEYEIIEEIDTGYFDNFKYKYLFQKQYIDLNYDAWKREINNALECCGLSDDNELTELQILDSLYRYMGGDPSGYSDGTISGNNRKECLSSIKAL